MMWRNFRPTPPTKPPNGGSFLRTLTLLPLNSSSLWGHLCVTWGNASCLQQLKGKRGIASFAFCGPRESPRSTTDHGCTTRWVWSRCSNACTSTLPVEETFQLGVWRGSQLSRLPVGQGRSTSSPHSRWPRTSVLVSQVTDEPQPWVGLRDPIPACTEVE